MRGIFIGFTCIVCSDSLVHEFGVASALELPRNDETPAVVITARSYPGAAPYNTSLTKGLYYA